MHPPSTDIYTLSLHDALPISLLLKGDHEPLEAPCDAGCGHVSFSIYSTEFVETPRSEEHTSELQSPDHHVCRLLLEKKKKITLSTAMNQTPLSIYNAF